MQICDFIMQICAFSVCISVSCKISMRKTNLLNSHAWILDCFNIKARNFSPYGGTRKTIRGTLNMHRYYLARCISSSRNKILKDGQNEKTGPTLLAMAKKQLAERRWKTRWSRETVNERPECSLSFSFSLGIEHKECDKMNGTHIARVWDEYQFRFPAIRNNRLTFFSRHQTM